MAVSVSSVSYTSATITASASSTASKDRYWTIYLNGAEYDYVYSKAQSISYTFYGLNEGTTYSVSVRYGPNYDDWSAGSTSFTTNVSVSYDADYAYVSYSRSYTSVTINITSITPRNYSREARFVIGNTRYTTTVGAYQTSTSYTFTGLNPGTSYYFEVGLRAPDNTRTFYQKVNGDGYVSTLSYATSDSAIASIGTVTDTSVYLNLTNITSRDYNRTVYFHWYNTRSGGSGSPSVTLSAGSTSTGRDMINLTSGTEYRFQIQIVNPNGTTTYTSSYLYATPTAYDHILTLTVTSTHNRIYATVTTNKLTTYDIDASFFLDGARELDATIPAGSYSRERYWYTDITPATSYTVSLYDNLLKYEVRSVNKRTKNNFSWTGGAKVKGSAFNLTATDWNEFTSQLKAKERWFTSNQRTFTSATKGNNFTAAMFNQAVASINNMVADGATDCVTTMSTVSKGDPVTASALNQLVACLNE